MTILLIAPQPFFQDRGTPIAVKLMAEALGELGHIVHLLVYHEGEDVTIPNVTIHRNIALPGVVNIKPGASLKKFICDIFVFFRCIQLLNTYKFDLVHAVEESVFMAIIIKLLYKVPYVYDMDSCMSIQVIDKFPILRLLRNPMNSLEKTAIKRSSGVIAVCKLLEETVQIYEPEKHLIRLEDISLVNQHIKGKERLREVYGISGPIIMYIGNLEKYQGIDLLIESFQQVKNKNIESNLVIIGGSEDDVKTYRRRVQQLGLADSVVFCGPRPILLLGYYLSQADILVSP